MDIANSYNIKLNNINHCVTHTIDIYRKALKFMINVVNNEWINIKDLAAKNKNNSIEKLVHYTKDNVNPTYNFDELFYKFPSYLRRCVINDAIGVVSSYYSNLDNYNKEKYYNISNGLKFKKKPPTLSLKHFKCPTLFNKQMFMSVDETCCKIKIYKLNKRNQTSDWVWLKVNFNKNDINYLKKNCSGLKVSVPILVKEHRNVYLKFCFSKQVKLPKEIKKVMGIDLGLNHSAVCSVMDLDGTVTNRLFINQGVEKDHLNRMLNHLKNKQRINNCPMPKVWAKINGLNKQIVNDTISKIVKFAIANKVDVIVLEHLEFKGKKVKKIAQRLHLWRVRQIIHKVEHKAHSNGIRMSTVNARNSSRLAYDGSGIVERSMTNAKLCTFPNGKQYNCDLNASYNIGARYIIRELLGKLKNKEYNLLMAKVPVVSQRTQCTLSTLRTTLRELKQK